MRLKQAVNTSARNRDIYPIDLESGTGLSEQAFFDHGGIFMRAKAFIQKPTKSKILNVI
jgi:hypothetical protein